MPSAFSVILAIVAGIIGVAATAIYVFGIPPAMKRQLEEKALETMGENKASYIMKDKISKLPTSDQEDVKEFQKGLGNALGGGLQNPLGKFGGNTADDLSRDFTGR